MKSKLEDIVTIHCNGQRELTTRQSAIKFYKRAVQCTEGSERERYTNVLMDLLDGKKVCKDI